jgi:hypothetical protein
MNRFWEVAQEVSERATRNSELMAH